MQALRSMLDSGPCGAGGWLLIAILWPFSMIYRVVVGTRSLLYRCGILPVYRPKVPVISVGNLTAGGTGKTPVCDLLIRRLIARGVRVAVVSRGYGGSFRGRVGKVSDGTGRWLMTPVAAGDEPCLLALRNPSASVYVARRRREGVAAAVADGAGCVVLDDAFQHLAVARDLDIVLLDARYPFGNGRLLPAGTLREPVSALSRADLLIMTHASVPVKLPADIETTYLTCRHRFSEHLIDAHGQPVSWQDAVTRPCFAFAGIAHPEAFFAALRGRGLQVAETWALSDHQCYTPQLLKRLADECNNGKLLVTTEKDAVKLLDGIFPGDFLRVPLELEVDGEEMLERVLDRVLDGGRR